VDVGYSFLCWGAVICLNEFGFRKDDIDGMTAQTFTHRSGFVCISERSYRCKDRTNIHSSIGQYFEHPFLDRKGVLIDTEWTCIFRILQSSIQSLRRELYTNLKVHLTLKTIEGRAHANRWPLSVDEKNGIGLMIAGGYPGRAVA
jgi:hypothetical protein